MTKSKINAKPPEALAFRIGKITGSGTNGIHLGHKIAEKKSRRAEKNTEERADRA